MALYHMLSVLGAGPICGMSVARCMKRGFAKQAYVLNKQWVPLKRQTLLLSSSLIVLQQHDEKDRPTRYLGTTAEHANLSPPDSDSSSFASLDPTSDMQLIDELKDGMPSSSDARGRIEAAKEKLANSLSEFTERLNATEAFSHMIAEHANLNTELIAETLSETIEETREAIVSITQRLVPVPSPPPPPKCLGKLSAERQAQHVDLALTEDIIAQNKRNKEEEDVEFVPRIKAAVRQFKAEIEADESGDPPISLVSRKAKARIEKFIKSKQDLLKEKIGRGESKDKTEQQGREMNKGITVQGAEEGVMHYITSKLPEGSNHHEDPELRDIISDSAGTFYNDSFLVDDLDLNDDELLLEQGWSKELQNEKLTIWKKLLSEEGITLYKIFGHFDTISAVEFYNAQVNDQYRTTWDKSVNNLYVVDNITNNREIVYWATKFPFPLQDRDYVFERRHLMDEKRGRIEIASRSITHKAKPVLPKFVRVLKYGSWLVIKADSTLYQKGMSYVLTYYDDFGMPIPNQVKDRLANSKIPEFLEKVHEAAVYLGSTGKLYVPYPEVEKHSSSSVQYS